MVVIKHAPLRIFCGYAHEDESLFHELKKSLAILIRQEAISVWHYGDLHPGAQWEYEIEQELNNADIILLLISPNFMASDYCYSKEMNWAITRSMTGAARVIPILGKPTPGWEATPLGQLQTLPTGLLPIVSWRERAEAFADITKGLNGVIHQMQQEDRYPIKEYSIATRPFVPQFVPQSEQSRMPRQRAIEQWKAGISQLGTLQLLKNSSLQEEWVLTYHQQACHITIEGSNYAILTSQHPSLLHQIIEIEKIQYAYLAWELEDDLNISELIKQIYEHSGKVYIAAREDLGFAQYTLHEKEADFDIYNHNGSKGIYYEVVSAKDPVKVMFSSNPPNIFFTHYNPTSGRGFYHAHKLFSIQKILSILHGKILYKEVKQLIEKACTP